LLKTAPRYSLEALSKDIHRQTDRQTDREICIEIDGAARRLRSVDSVETVFPGNVGIYRTLRVHGMPCRAVLG